MAVNVTAHSGAEHGGITLKGVDTSARPMGRHMMDDPQLDMRTWKPPKQSKPSTGSSNGNVQLTPQQRSRIQAGKSKLA